mgnify:CR=1 FL=1
MVVNSNNNLYTIILCLQKEILYNMCLYFCIILICFQKIIICIIQFCNLETSL